MKKQFWLKSFFLVFTGLMLSMPGVASAQDPVAMLNSLAERMISSLKAEKMTIKSNPTRVYSLAHKLVVPHADLDYMSRRVLPAQTWNQATPGQRSEFKKEFTTLLVRTYASALADYSDQTVKFYPVRGGTNGKGTVTVRSQIVRNDGPSIPVSYSLVSTGGGWKLFDMTVEGVSMLQSFRSQFADNLSRGNIAALITALKQHNHSNGN